MGRGEDDQSAVRFTQDVDLLIRRSDLEAAKKALAPAGFVYRHSARIDMFLDGPNAKARDSVHVIFAGEKIRPEYALPAPDVTDAEASEAFRVLQLDALVRMKLTSFRDKDRTHLRDILLHIGSFLLLQSLQLLVRLILLSQCAQHRCQLKTRLAGIRIQLQRLFELRLRFCRPSQVSKHKAKVRVSFRMIRIQGNRLAQNLLRLRIVP